MLTACLVVLLHDVLHGLAAIHRYASLYVVEYPNCTFWHLLDAIGIDAYFPLTTTANPSPTVQQLTNAWCVSACVQFRLCRLSSRVNVQVTDFD